MRITFQQLADFAATQSGEYDVHDTCNCPMAQVARAIFKSKYANAYEANVQVDDGIVSFPESSFFTKFIEPFSTWEDLTATLQRAAKEETRV